MDDRKWLQRGCRAQRLKADSQGFTWHSVSGSCVPWCSCPTSRPVGGASQSLRSQHHTPHITPYNSCLSQTREWAEIVQSHRQPILKFLQWFPKHVLSGFFSPESSHSSCFACDGSPLSSPAQWPPVPVPRASWSEAPSSWDSHPSVTSPSPALPPAHSTHVLV